MFDDPEQLRVAESAYRVAIRQDPGKASMHNGLGNILYALDRSDEAEAAFREALRIDPSLAEAHNGLGDVLRKSGRAGQAEAAFREAISINPGHALAHRGLGFTLCDQSRFKEAEGAFREAIRLKPHDANSHRGLGDALQEMGRFDDTELEYRFAIRLNPIDADSHHGLGNALQAMERSEDAVAAYQEATALAPWEADLHKALGDALLEAGRQVEAIEAYHAAVAMAEDFYLLRDLADSAKGLEEHDLAEIAYHKAIDAEGGSTTARIALGEYLQTINRFAGAIDAYRDAYDEADGNDDRDLAFDALLELAENLRGSEHLDDAEAAFRAAIGIADDLPELHISLGEILEETERFDEAIDAYRGALDADFDDGDKSDLRHTLLRLGDRLRGMKRPDAAAEAYRAAIEAVPEEADTHALLGDILLDLGRPAEAAESFREAIRLDPDNDFARDALDVALSKIAAQQSAPRSAGLFLDDLRTLASWFASAGLAEVPLLGGYVPAGLPDNLAKVRARLLEFSALDVLPSSRTTPDIAELMEAELRKLEDRERAIEILSRRTFALEQETLDAIGRSWGITRERVRHLEVKACTGLTRALAENEQLRLAAAEIRGLIGALLPLGDLLRLVPALADEVKSVGQPAWQVLAAFDDAYEIEHGWCAAPAVREAKTATDAWVREHANRHGVAAMSGFTLLHGSHQVARPQESTRGWLAYCGYEVQGDWIFTRTGTIGERVAAMLSVVGSPLSAQEILDRLPGSRSLASLRNALGIDERFDRVDRDEWALSEWGLEPYNGIKDQIHHELARGGGEVSIDLLIETIAGRYSVAPGSVRAYASSPPFESSNGLVRFSTGDRVSSKTLTSTRRLYQQGNRWLFRIPVTGEHLRGSGSPAPVALATRIGLQRGAHLRLTSPLDSQLFSWAGLQPAFGSIQRFLIERNITAGQEVFLIVGANLSFNVVPVESGRTSPLARGLALAGRATIDAPQAWFALAMAIGLPKDAPASSIIAGYRDRGDSDIADLLLAVHPR